MNNDNFLKNLDKEATAFYKNEGNKIYNDIINKYNNNIINGEQVIYLLKWCCNYFKRYYIDDWTHWSSSYISEFIDNNLDIFIPYDTFKYGDVNIEKYLYIIQSDLFVKLDDILKKYYNDEDMEIYDTKVNEIDFKIVITKVEMDKFKWKETELGTKYQSDMFNFACYCHDNFIKYAYMFFNYYLKLYIGIDYDDVNIPHYFIERESCLKNESVKKGFRKDLDMGFRSSWEANFARVLDYHNINYDYENRNNSYKLKTKEGNAKYQSASMMYLPDFKIDTTLIEVKGELDNRSLQNIALFRELYPNDYENLIIIDSDIYYMLSNKYKTIISNWEDDNIKVLSNKIIVVGINYNGRKQYVSKLSNGDELFYSREPENKYDHNAIQIKDKDGNMIGYISSDYANYYAPKMDYGIKYKITLKSVEENKLIINIKAENLDDLNIDDYLSFLGD